MALNSVKNRPTVEEVGKIADEVLGDEGRKTGDPIIVKKPLDAEMEARIQAEVESRLKAEKDAGKEPMTATTISLKESDLWKLKAVVAKNRKAKSGPTTVTALLLQAARACGHLND